MRRQWVGILLSVALLLWGALPAFAFKLPFHTSRGDYTFPTAGPFHDLDIHLTWQEVSKPPAGLGYYAMFAFYFQNKTVGYTGLQWDNEGKKAIFSIWDASGSAGSAVPEGQCKRFGHEGSGAQCIVPYEWQQGREYLLKIRPVGRTAGGEQWQSLIRELTTGRESVIGTLTMQDSGGYVGYGHLSGKGVSVLEYYGSAHLEACSSLPVVVLSWRGPFANDRQLRAKGVSLSYSQQESCTNSNLLSPGRGQMEQRAGGETQRLTPNRQQVEWPQILMLK
ncbi:MAG: DUF3472 domain-containing protein [Magnetococcales bacterium]|nr:DUF3472 domain-containing protein [Magnetococcales bacterium]